MLKVLRVPKVQISLLLFVLFFLVAPRIGITLSVTLLVLCLTSTIVSDLLFAYIRKHTFFIPHAAVVTGLILTLIIDTNSEWYQVVFVCVIAMAIKNFLRLSGRHIFNPAASGLVVGYLVFGIQPSWWGPTFYLGGFSNPVNVAVFVTIIAFSYVSVKRMRRFGVFVAYLFSTSLFTFLASAKLALSVGLSVFVSPGVLFYGLLMAPEPMTSPVRLTRQILFGVFVSGMTYFIVQFVVKHSLVQGNFPDATLVALLLGNLVFFKFR